MKSAPVQLNEAPQLPTGKRRLGRRRLLTMLGIAFAVPLLALGAAQRRTNAAPPIVEEATAPRPAETVPVRRQDLTGKLQLAATSTAVNAFVAAPLDRSAKALVVDGATVASGDPLLRVAPDKSTLAEARDAVANATAALGRASDAETSGASLAEQSESSARRTLQRAKADLDATRGVSPPVDTATATAANRALEDAETSLADTLRNNDLAAAALRRDTDDAQAALDDAKRRLNELEADTVTLTAPAAGTVHFDQAMNATITGDFAITANVLPLQHLRLRSGTLRATAQIEGIDGQQTIECQTVTIIATSATEPAPGNATASNDAAPAAAPDGSSAVRCTADQSIPPIAGLQAQLRIEIKLATDALVVPDLAIAYVDGAPTVTLTDGTSVAVELGPTDGVLRVVDGVDEGVEVVVP